MPETQVPLPIQLVPPHCDQTVMLPPDGGGCVGLLGGVVVVVEPPVNVELMSPNLMFENVTLLLASVLSTVVGSPEVVEQGPRTTPGEEAEPLVG